MFNHHQRVTAVAQLEEHLQQFGDVLEVQPRGRLIEEIQNTAGLTSGQFGRKFQSLSLASGERRGRLPQPEITQTHFGQGQARCMELGHSPKETHRLIDGELKDIGDVQALVSDLQRLAVVALPAAGLAGDIDRRKKVHLNFEKTISLALLAAPAFDIEAKATGVVAANPGRGDRGEEIPDLVEHPGVGGRVGSWGATNGCLIDDDALLEELQIANLAMSPRTLFRSIPLAEKGAPQNVIDKRGLATAADAGHARHRSQRDAGIDIAQIILGGSEYLDPPLVLARFDPVAWHRNAQISGKVTPGAGTRMGHDFSRSSVGHQFATMDSGSGPHV